MEKLKDGVPCISVKPDGAPLVETIRRTFLLLPKSAYAQAACAYYSDADELTERGFVQDDAIFRIKFRIVISGKEFGGMLGYDFDNEKKSPFEKPRPKVAGMLEVADGESYRLDGRGRIEEGATLRFRKTSAASPDWIELVLKWK